MRCRQNWVHRALRATLGDRLGSPEPSRRDFGRSTGRSSPLERQKFARAGRRSRPRNRFGSMLARCWCRNNAPHRFVDERGASDVSSVLFATFLLIFWRRSCKLVFAEIGLGQFILRYGTSFRHSWRSRFRRNFCFKFTLELQAVFERKIH